METGTGYSDMFRIAQTNICKQASRGNGKHFDRVAVAVEKHFDRVAVAATVC